MFEDYLEDAYFFASQAEAIKDAPGKKRHYRAAVLYAASAVEAFVNYIAETLGIGQALEPFEAAFLLDRRFGLNQGSFELLEATEFHRTEDKLRVLLAKFRPNYDVKHEPSWSHLAELRALRDGIVHPRDPDDALSPDEYRNRLARGLNAAIHVMDELCQGIFKKRLRKRLLDLAGNPVQ